MAAQAIKDKIIEEAVQYSQHFPDEYDWQICEVVADVVGVEFDEDTFLGRLAITAYDLGQRAARMSIWYR
jgi:hypothetical protein